MNRYRSNVCLPYWRIEFQHVRCDLGYLPPAKLVETHRPNLLLHPRSFTVFTFFTVVAACAFVFSHMEISAEQDQFQKYGEVLLELNQSNVSRSTLNKLEMFLPPIKDFQRWSKPRQVVDFAVASWDVWVFEDRATLRIHTTTISMI